MWVIQNYAQTVVCTVMMAIGTLRKYMIVVLNIPCNSNFFRHNFNKRWAVYENDFAVPENDVNCVCALR